MFKGRTNNVDRKKEKGKLSLKKRFEVKKYFQSVSNI